MITFQDYIGECVDIVSGRSQYFMWNMLWIQISAMANSKIFRGVSAPQLCILQLSSCGVEDFVQSISEKLAIA